MQAGVGLGAVQRVGRFLDSGQGLLRLRPRSKPEVGEHRIVVWFAVCNAPFRPACGPICGHSYVPKRARQAAIASAACPGGGRS